MTPIEQKIERYRSRVQNIIAKVPEVKTLSELQELTEQKNHWENQIRILQKLIDNPLPLN